MEIFNSSYHDPYWLHWEMDWAQKPSQHHISWDESEVVLFYGKVRGRDNSNPWSALVRGEKARKKKKVNK